MSHAARVARMLETTNRFYQWPHPPPQAVTTLAAIRQTISFGRMSEEPPASILARIEAHIDQMEKRDD